MSLLPSLFSLRAPVALVADAVALTLFCAAIALIALAIGGME